MPEIPPLAEALSNTVSLDTEPGSHSGAAPVRARPRPARALPDVFWLALLTLGSIAVAGYHPAAEDGGIYLSAVQHRLNPALFPWDSDFLTVKLQASFFDKLLANTVLFTHAQLASLLFSLHLVTVFAFLAACWRLACACFAECQARWAAVTLTGVLLTLPVSGTGLYLVDQNLVPRTISVTLVLFAACFVLDGRWFAALALLLAALPFQPVLAALGISLCVFLALPKGWTRVSALAASFLPWELLRPGQAPPALHHAIAMHHYCDLAHWAWYEWLGVLAPVALLLLFAQQAALPCSSDMRRRLVAQRTAGFAVFQLLVAMVMMLPPSLERLRPFEPMRYLYFVYVLLILLAGGWLGKYVLRRRTWRWAALFLPLALGMFLVQRLLYPASPHLEFPWTHTVNPWVRAFVWARGATPPDAYFVLGAGYQARPGEDHQVFRAVAQRSMMADRGKDSGMALTSSQLADRWLREVSAQEALRWPGVSAPQLHALRAEFGVTWAVLEGSEVTGLDCPYRNEQVAVCRID